MYIYTYLIFKNIFQLLAVSSVPMSTGTPVELCTDVEFD